jgi:hypothetical protein
VIYAVMMPFLCITRRAENTKMVLDLLSISHSLLFKRGFLPVDRISTYCAVSICTREKEKVVRVVPDNFRIRSFPCLLNLGWL